MTLNQWDSRSKSTGFYNIIEEQMIGLQSDNIIRRYGTFWYDHGDNLLRLYLYENRNLADSGRSILKLAEIGQNMVDNKFDSELPPPTIQQNFAEDWGEVRDQVQIWNLGIENRIHFYDSFFCTKITKVHHIIQYYATKTAKYDYHFLIKQDQNPESSTS